MRLIIVRHGLTGQSGILGQFDVPLSPDGELQASRAGARLRQFSPARLLSSDLRRAAVTAEIIGQSLGLAVQPMSALRERSFGRWEGLSADDVGRQYPALYAAWRRGEPIAPPDGESGDEVRRRAERVLPLIDASPAVIVSHLGMIRALVSVMTGIDAHAVRRLRFDHCGLSVIDLGHRPVLALINDTCHLV